METTTLIGSLKGLNPVTCSHMASLNAARLSLQPAEVLLFLDSYPWLILTTTLASRPKPIWIEEPIVRRSGYAN